MMAESGDMDVNKTEQGRVVSDVKIDLEERDPNDLNTHVQVAVHATTLGVLSYLIRELLHLVLFEDVIGEPQGAHSADAVWTWSFKCFTGGKRICYMILTYVCAIPLALYWGCTFAWVSFCHIWCITPSFKNYSINMKSAQRFFTVFLNCFLVPWVETCALIFSKIKIQINRE